MAVRRFESVQELSGSYLAPATSYRVTAMERGGIVSSASSGSTITFGAAGHGFATGDKIGKVGANGWTFYSGTDTVQSSNATSITMGNNYTVSVGDVIVNLGADTGTSAPAYDAGPSIYSDPGLSSALSNSTATTNSGGEYEYYHGGSTLLWELVRTASAPVEVIVDAVLPRFTGPTSSTDNAVVRFDGTGGLAVQSSSITIDDNGHMLIDGADELRFRDTGLTIKSSADGQLDIDADGVLELGAPIVRTTAAATFTSGGKFVMQGTALLFADGDTTPSVSSGNVFGTANTGATAITTFDNGSINQLITIIVQDANTDFTNGASLKLAGAANWTTAAAGDVITFVFDGGVWYEVGRSDNT